MSSASADRATSGSSRILIVGASLAGMSAAQSIRSAGHTGQLTVVDGSPTLPSDRPPLSKQVLAGEWDIDKAAQPVARVLDELDLDLRLGVTASSLAVDGKNESTVALSDGTVVEARSVLIAGGSYATNIGQDIPEGVFVLRTAADCLSIRAELESEPSRVVVIGAGFIGAEVAATCRSRGLEVTMIEAAEVPLQRVLPGRIGQFVADLHRGNGVDVRLGVGLDSFESDAARRVSAVVLGDGTRIDASLVVVGVGAAPQIDWLRNSAVTLADRSDGGGVVCDDSLRAAPGVVAAGDIASWENPLFGGERMRVEHWENAIEQGFYAGKRILADLGESADPGPFSSVPWFWSDQFDAKIQMVGRAGPQDELHIVDGAPEDGKFVALFKRGNQCRAALGVNRPRLVMQARMKLSESLEWAAVKELFD